MNHTEAQELLNNMLPQLSVYKRNRNADGKLSTSDKDRLYDIIIDIEEMSGRYKYDLAIKDTKLILDTYTPVIMNGNKRSRPDVIPFLVIQVIFYIAVKCVYYRKNSKSVSRYWTNFFNMPNRLPSGYTQAKLLDDDLELAHNFFGKLQRTPKEYMDMREHKQPERVITYNGQKDGELGVAIKYLVYQAGKHDYYVDLFGGTGAASTAMNRRNGTTYVYNEKDEVVYNLFRVIEDNKLYKHLIDEIKQLKDALYFVNKDLQGINFNEEIKEFYKRDGERKPSETRINNYKRHKYNFDNAEDWMQKLIDNIKKQPNEFKFTCLNTTYTKQDLLNILDTSNLIGSMNANWNIVLLYSDTIQGDLSNDIPRLADLYDVCGYTCEELRREEIQYNFYKYYAYFYNLIKKMPIPVRGNEVRYAVAYVFIYSLLTNGNAGVSSVLRMDIQYDDGVMGNVSGEWIKFLGTDYFRWYKDYGIPKDFEILITEMHNAIKGTICENEDCLDIIKKYNSQGNIAKCPLFYSDSPYISTTGYGPKFTEKDMIDLTKALLDSGDKFIFSCRAVKGKRDSVTTEKLIKDNIKIAEYTFGSFFDYWEKGQKLYVLAIEEGKSLKDAIKDNDDIEIMITNYEIKSFIDCDYKNVSYTVYDFAYLLKAILQYGNVGLTQQQIQALFTKYNLSMI